MRAIILGGKGEMRERVFYLVTEEGEPLFAHYCSNWTFAEKDFTRTNERMEILKNKNITEIVWLEDSGLSKEEILSRIRKKQKQEE